MEWGGRESFLVALICAEAALPVWELAHPEDKRPRLATEAARAWLKDPTVGAVWDAIDAGRAAGEAADGPRCAANAGVMEPVLLRAFAREVAGTPLERFVTAELL